MPALIPLITEGLALFGITEGAGAAFTALKKVLMDTAQKEITGGMAKELAVKEALSIHAAELQAAKTLAETEAKAAAKTAIKPTKKKLTPEEIAKGKKRLDDKKESLLGSGAKFVAGTAGAGIIFDLTGRAMHPNEGSSEQGGGGTDADAMQQFQTMMQQGGMVNSDAELQKRFNRSQGAVNSYNIANQLNQGPPTSGVSGDLDVLIRGHENLLGQISARQPMTMAQALAQQGVVLPPRNSQGTESLYG